MDLFNPMNPMNYINPASPYYQGNVVEDSEPVDVDLSSLMSEMTSSLSVSDAFGETLDLFHMLFPIVLMVAIPFIIITVYKLFKRMLREYGYEEVPKSPKAPKTKPEKPNEPIYKSDDGKGYWVRGYGDEITYVSLTDLYPAGTNMDELRDLKSKEEAK
ncbi:MULTISPECIES: hypothetical protein [unclassified Paenibacillus]|uniref:hypothetical protein n=1 Tax=unclassified Paenibacillus TaxID=185978 RepID=UPI0004244550|nr:MULTISPECIES: hypothetical protein [unclassified Paenibacillus]KGP85301.1 hypothetical protein P364_0101405 [Paenibacillus sp. MAEPY2]KGP88143.1 hypothetical protein P363_0108255 [Paenibacillus sp. MAEPY1]